MADLEGSSSPSLSLLDHSILDLAPERFASGRAAAPAKLNQTPSSMRGRAELRGAIEQDSGVTADYKVVAAQRYLKVDELAGEIDRSAQARAVCGDFVRVKCEDLFVGPIGDS